MEDWAFRQPELMGRGEELDTLSEALSGALEGKGSTFLICGEAGIGKTRLVSELIKKAAGQDVRVIIGWCLAESLEPLMPIKTGLRESGLEHLIAGDPPPMVVSAYLMNQAGMLIAKAEREETSLDSDIFAGMLQAVGNFVQDSLSMMDKADGSALNSLGYGEHTILIQTAGDISLATVIKGTNSEFLIDDMKRTLTETGDRCANWSGDEKEASEVIPKLSWFIDSGKYDGRFLVDDPKMRQENLFDNVLMGLRRASMKRPLLLFLDDLQWADPTTLNLLHYLARNTRSDRILTLGTYRPEDVIRSEDGRPHPLETAMQNMSREHLFERIELKRLGPEDTKGMINSALGEMDFDEGFFEKAYKETEGTPFFVLEVIKLLMENRAIVPGEDGVWKLVLDIEGLDIPSKVYDVVKRRLDRLIQEQRDLLECASVIGQEFSTDILERATEMRRITLLKNLSEIEKNHQLILFLQDKYRFNHAKVREVLYNGMGEELRREYHKIVGDTLEELFTDRIDDAVSDLAYHYSEAGDGKAKDYLVKAGDRARARFANEEAIRFYLSALQLMETEDEQKHIHENLGKVLAHIGEMDGALDHYDKAYEFEKDDVKKADLHIQISNIHERKGDYRGVMEECVKGLELIGDKDIPERADLLVVKGSVYLRIGEFDNCIEFASQGLALAEKLGSRLHVAKAGQVLGVVYIFKGEFDTALEHLTIALDTYEEIGKITPTIPILSNIGLVNRDQGRFEEARKLFERANEIAEKIGDKWGISSSLNNLGLIYRDTGDQDRALELFERGLSISRMMDDKYSIALRYYNIGEVHMNRDEMPEALDYLKKALAIFLEVDSKRNIIETHINLAFAHMKIDDLDSALTHATVAVDISVEIGARGVEPMARLCLARILVDLKELGKAGEELEETSKVLKEVEDRQQLAGLHFQYGRLYKARREPERAKAELVKALTMFREMGMKAWVGEAREELEGL
jgi:adenylate cyclase